MEKTPYENKSQQGRQTRARPATEGRKSKTPVNIRVEVIKEHCGIRVGEVFLKPCAIAQMMIKKGYYKKSRVALWLQWQGLRREILKLPLMR